MYDLQSDESTFQPPNPRDGVSCPRIQTEQSCHRRRELHPRRSASVHAAVSVELRSSTRCESVSRRSECYLQTEVTYVTDTHVILITADDYRVNYWLTHLGTPKSRYFRLWGSSRSGSPTRCVRRGCHGAEVSGMNFHRPLSLISDRD